MVFTYIYLPLQKDSFTYMESKYTYMKPFYIKKYRITKVCTGRVNYYSNDFNFFIKNSENTHVNSEANLSTNF